VRADGLLGVLALLVPGAVTAQVLGNVALLSDYRFRGESLTERRPALQAAVNYDHSTGLFLGGLVSNVRIDPDVSGLSAQIYGGYAHPVGERASWDVGVVTYVFPRPAVGPKYDYTEAFIGASFDTLSSRLNYTDSYFGGGKAVYLELSATRPIADRISLIGHLGYLDLGQPREPLASGQRRGLVDFLAGINIDVSGFTLGLSVVGTDAQQHGCPAGTGRCSTTAVLSVSHTF
jgi:uncharacterized protein (TIGR02001 family)